MNDDAHTDQPLLLGTQALEGFWQAFAYDERNLALLPDQEFVAKANDILALYAPELALELEHSDGSLFKRLIISAHGNTEQFENAMALVRAAPSLPGYKVQAFRNRTLGSDFSTQEQDLLRALNWLKSKFKLTQIYELGKATLDAPAAQAFPEHLSRMGLEKPEGLREELYQRLLLAGLQATAKTGI